VVIELVVRRPHPLVRRNRDQQLSSRFEARGEAGDCRIVVVDVLDHVERRNQVVPAPLDARQLGKRCRGHRAAQPFLGEPPRLRIDLDPVDRTEPLEHPDIVAGPAADFENPRILRRLDGPADKRVENLAAGAVPPMKLIELRHPVVNHPLHQRKTHCRLKM